MSTAADDLDRQALDLIIVIADLTKDGELTEDGEEFDLTNDDAVDTLHSLISAARDILGLKDNYPE